MKKNINNESEVKRKPLHGLAKDWSKEKFLNCTPMYPIKIKEKGSHWLCRCKCGKLFIASTANFIRDKNISCGCSSNKNVNLKNQHFGKLIALEPTNKRRGTNIIWRCKCECGNIVEVSTNDLTSMHTQSCGCLNNSKGEEAIQKLLQQNNIVFERQKRFNSCKDKKSLPFDFYLPNYNCLIEYDGIQHFGLGNFWGDKNYYSIIKKHDIIKNNWCKENNIHLIRVPYWHLKNLSIQDLLPQISSFLLF